MIKIHLSRLLDEKEITQYKFKELTGIRPGTINAYYHGFVKRMNVKDLEIMCEILNCRLEELIEILPDQK